MYILFAQSIAKFTINLFSFQNILLLLTRCYQIWFYWYGNNATRSCETLFIYFDWGFQWNEPNPICAFPVLMGFFESPSTQNLSPSEAEPKQSNIPELFGNSEEPNSSVMQIEDVTSWNENSKIHSLFSKGFRVGIWNI